MQPKAQRMICWYSKDNELLVGEHVIERMDLQTLQRLFGYQDSDPLLYLCYPIRAREADEIMKLESVQFDLAAYDYFLECEAA